MAAKNQVLKSFIGQGYYGTHTPGVILRNVLESPAWYTAYTPYQPEISQGRLEALVNFQTMICDLTGMAIANASMLDEATAAAEAMTLCQRIGRSKQQPLLRRRRRVSRRRSTSCARAPRRSASKSSPDPRPTRRRRTPSRCCCSIRAPTAKSATIARSSPPCTRRGGLVIVAADLLALTLLTPPGEWGADVVVGSAQRFGVPMGYGGPHAGYLATRDDFKRTMPGRLVGVTVDADGGPAYRLALQTREQHIRREKATSNICTAQVLLAVIAGMYAVYHGPAGLATIARRVHRLTAILKAGLERLGHAVPTSRFFDTLTVATGDATQAILDRGVAERDELPHRRCAHAGAIARRDHDARRRRGDLAGVRWPADAGRRRALHHDRRRAIRKGSPAQSAFLTHPTFNRYHSETEMLRYLRRLADRDIALDRAMIPLGSCTMKLNATSEMIPVTWPEFGELHPFAPADQAAGLSRSRRRTRADALRRDGLRGGVAAAQRRARRASTRGSSSSRRITRAAARVIATSA